jgi:hypothetical protein
LESILTPPNLFSDDLRAEIESPTAYLSLLISCRIRAGLSSSSEGGGSSSLPGLCDGLRAFSGSKMDKSDGKAT